MQTKQKSHPKGSPTPNPKEHVMQSKSKASKKSSQSSQANPNPEVATSEQATAPAPKKVIRLPAGMRQPLPVFGMQVVACIRNGKRFKAGLKKGGFMEEDNAQMESMYTDFKALYLTFGDDKKAAKAATVKADADFADAIVFRNQAHAGLKIATQGKEDLFSAKRLQLKRTRSAVVLGQWFEDILPFVKQYKDELAPRLGGDPVALTESHQAKLRQSVVVQRMSQKEKGELSAKQRAAKLKLATKMEEQRLAATIAFQRDPATLKKFVPLWNVKRRAAKAADPATPADPTSGSAANPASGSVPSTPAPANAADAKVEAAAAKPSAR